MEVKPKINAITIGIFFIVLFALIVFLYLRSDVKMLNPGYVVRPSAELPYAYLEFERLARRPMSPEGEIIIGEELAKNERYSSYLFEYKSQGKRISGQINLPNLSRLMGVVVMARGYAPKEGYFTGLGTRSAAAVYASNGYITLAPDFLGYGQSEMEDTDSLGARLYRPVEILDLLRAIPSLPQADLSQVVLWGHSNGGQIMLSVAEILGMQQPQESRAVDVRGVILWAPVSKPFPYSILAFSDEAEDQGKALRAGIAKFESQYDVFRYSIDRYLDKIGIPVLLHQGTADDAVPYWWSDQLAEELRERDKTVIYHRYPGADHNLRPSWEVVVGRDREFLQSVE